MRRWYLYAMWQSLLYGAVYGVDSTPLQKEGSELEWPVCHEQPHKPASMQSSKCPRTFKPYAIVAAGTRHNTSWVHSIAEDVEGIVYQHHSPAEPYYFTGEGFEAGAYLQFIVDYYDCLPQAVAFVHGHAHEEWHNRHHMVETMQSLNWDLIPGYTDLNRAEVWELQMSNRPKYPSDKPVATGDDVFSGSYLSVQIMGGNAYSMEETKHFLQREANVHAYDKFFGRIGLGAMPDKIGFICCPQFAVTRERIQARSKNFWNQNLHYLHNNDIQSIQHWRKGRVVADIWTIYWAMLFGEPAYYQRVIADEKLFSKSPKPASQ